MLKKLTRACLLSFLTSIMVLSAAITITADELFTGEIYLAGTNKGLLIFRQKNSVLRKNDQLILRHTYTTPKGALAVQEDVIFEKGIFKRYLVEFKGSDCGCTLDKKGNKLVFGFTRGDKDKKGTADYKSNLVMGPTLTRFVHRNWSRLRSGKRAFFNLPAMSLQRIARFRMHKNTKSPWNRPGVLVVKMEVANVFFRLFVDPVDLVYDLKTKRLLEIHGKSLLERKVNGKVENPVVDIYYKYKN